MKRRRGERTGKKRREEPAEDEDEEIVSSSSDGEGGVPEHDEFFEQISSEGEGDGDEDHTAETAQEKRIRLAKNYLSEIGVSVKGKTGRNAAPNRQAGSDSEQDEEDEDEAEEGERLRRERLVGDAMLHKGRGITRIADTCGISSTLHNQSCRSVRGHKLSATCVAISDDETRAVTGSKDRSLAIWDTETGKTYNFLGGRQPSTSQQDYLRQGGHVGNVLAVALTGDGSLIASSGDDRVVRLWDPRLSPSSAAVGTLKGHRAAVNSVSFRKGSNQLFSASDDQTLKVWDAGERTYVETLFGHGAEVCCTDSLVRERVLSGARDGTIRLWKVVEGSQLVFRTSTLCVDTVAMTTETSFVTGGDDGSLSGWSITKKKPTSVVSNSHGAGKWISALGAPRFSDLVASGASDGSLRFWKFGSATKVGMLDLEARASVRLPGVINGIAFGEAKRIAAVAVGDEHRLGRWFDKIKCRNGLAVVTLPSS